MVVGRIDNAPRWVVGGGKKEASLRDGAMQGMNLELCEGRRVT